MIRKSFCLDVTAVDIEKGEQSTINKCAGARALKRVHGCTHIGFRDGQIKFNLNGTRYFCSMPDIVREQISNFDEDKKLMKPFKAILKVTGTGDIVTKQFTGDPSKNSRKKNKRTNKNKPKICRNDRFTSGSYNKKYKEALKKIA